MPSSQLFAGDILEGTDALKKALQEANAMIIATSAIPEIKPLSLIRVKSALQAFSCCGTPLVLHKFCATRIATDVASYGISMLQIFWQKLLRQEGARPDFKFKKDQYPEQVDCAPNLTEVSAMINMNISPFDLSPIQQSRQNTQRTPRPHLRRITFNTVMPPWTAVNS